MSDFDQDPEPSSKEPQSDFQILVTEPTRSEKDFSAKITTKTTLSQFKASNFFCLRGYADFVWLSEELTQKHLDCIIPILPPKSLVKVSENLERLFCSSLQFYLNRIAAHPILQKDPNFQKFLEGETIVPSKKTQTQLIGEAGMEVLSLLKKTAEGDTYFEDKRAFVNIHENNTKSCAKAVERLHKAGASFSASTKDAGAKYVAVADATTEEKLSTGLKSAGKSLEQHHEILATQIENQQELLTEFFHQGARDLQAGRNALDNRLQMSVDYDKAVKNTKSKREAFEKLRANPQTKPDKLSKGQADVAEAEKQESDAKDLFFNTTENLKNEFTRLEKERVQVSKEKLKEHVQNQIYYEKKSLKIFQDLLLEVEAISL